MYDFVGMHVNASMHMCELMVDTYGHAWLNTWVPGL